jgi:hypothetical protein
MCRNKNGAISPAELLAERLLQAASGDRMAVLKPYKATSVQNLVIILWQDKNKRSTMLLLISLLTELAFAGSVACASQPRPSAYGPTNVVRPAKSG